MTLRSSWRGASLLLLALLSAAPAEAARREAPAEPAMTRYRLGLLWRGPTWTPERTARTDSIQAEHLANIGRMFDEGVLLGAGPFGSSTDLRGLFIFRADTTDDLGPLLARDPAIASGRLRLELVPLVAPAGISREFRRRRAAGLRDSMVVVSWVFLRRGPNWTANITPKVDRVLRRHRDYAAKLREEGRLPFAGGIEGTGDLRGVLAFRGDTTEARRLTDADPAIRAGRFRAEIHPWWNALGTLPGF